MRATSHVQFEQPRLERRPENHRSPAAARRHTRRGAGIQGGAVHGCGPQRGQGRGSQGVHLGIITRGIARGPGGASTEAGLAVPVETVTGRAKESGKQALGSSAALETAASRPSPSSAAVVASRAQDTLRAVRTLHLARRGKQAAPVAA